jgi:hypothetical protein
MGGIVAGAGTFFETAVAAVAATARPDTRGEALAGIALLAKRAPFTAAPGSPLRSAPGPDRA